VNEGGVMEVVGVRDERRKEGSVSVMVVGIRG